jgi:hypothetical protein
VATGERRYINFSADGDDQRTALEALRANVLAADSTLKSSPGPRLRVKAIIRCYRLGTVELSIQASPSFGTRPMGEECPSRLSFLVCAASSHCASSSENDLGHGRARRPGGTSEGSFVNNTSSESTRSTDKSSGALKRGLTDHVAADRESEHECPDYSET